MSRFVLVFIAFVIAGVIVFIDTRSLIFVSSLNNTQVATLIEVKGPVTLRGPHYLTARPVQAPKAISARDIVATGTKATAILNFENGAQILVKSNARITVDAETGSAEQINATVQLGEIEWRVRGEGDRLRVWKNGRQLEFGQTEKSPVPIITLGGPEPEKIETSPTVSTTVPEEKEAPAKNPSKLQLVLPPKKTTAKVGIADEEISRTLSAQMGFFRRCFLGYISRSGEKNAKGTLFVSFDIAGNGKVEGTQLLDSPFQDATFNSCVVEVVNRTSFRTFEGQTIKIGRFPITIE